MRKTFIAVISLFVIFAVTNAFGCPSHDKAKTEADASKASADNNAGSCAMSGTKTMTTLAKSTDHIQASQTVVKKDRNQETQMAKARETMKTTKPLPVASNTTAAKQKKDAHKSNTYTDMGVANKNN